MTGDGRPPAPDFVIIGAMKAATSTLHDQLAEQDGFFMSTPKEPCYFSDDEIHARGDEWYASLFAGAGPDDLRGESSTHYTKLPTHPRTVQRLAAHPSRPRFVYVVRHPVERLISHHLHARSMKEGPDSLIEALEVQPELIDYGRYSMQIRPWVEAFGRDRIHVVMFERLVADPAREFEALGAFLGAPRPLVWRERPPSNVSAQRLRVSPWRDRIVDNPLVQRFRRRFVPKSVRTRIASLWQIQDRPELDADVRRRLEAIFDEDLADFASLCGMELSCAIFAEAAGT